jgi:hypothetical protein
MRVRELDAIMRLFHERFRSSADIEALDSHDDPMLGELRALALSEGLIR